MTEDPISFAINLFSSVVVFNFHANFPRNSMQLFVEVLTITHHILVKWKYTTIKNGVKVIIWKWIGTYISLPVKLYICNDMHCFWVIHSHDIIYFYFLCTHTKIAILFLQQTPYFRGKLSTVVSHRLEQILLKFTSDFFLSH